MSEWTSPDQAARGSERSMSKEECGSNTDADDNYHTANDRGINLPGESCTGITTDDCGNKHQRGLQPPNLAGNNEATAGSRVHHTAQQRPSPFHRMNVSKSSKTPDCQHDDADGTTEIAAVNADQELKSNQQARSHPRMMFDGADNSR